MYVNPLAYEVHLLVISFPPKYRIRDSEMWVVSTKNIFFLCTFQKLQQFFNDNYRSLRREIDSFTEVQSQAV